MMRPVARRSFYAFMLGCSCLFAGMGVWQVKRLHWKQGLVDNIDAVYAEPVSVEPVAPEIVAAMDKQDFLRGVFQGRLNFDAGFGLSGQIDDARPSIHRMVPLILENGDTMLVDFGPDIVLPQGIGPVETLSGLVKALPVANRFTPDNDPARGVYFSIHAANLKIDNLLPVMLLPEMTAYKNFPARKPELRNAHLQYAIFWFTMSAVVLALTVFTRIKKLF